MVSIVDNAITLVRGDTLEIPIYLKTKKGDPYIPAEGDIIRFALKESYDDNSPVLIKKTIPNDTMLLHLDPCDTQGLVARKKSYVYDIELTTAHGYVDTIIRSVVYILEEVC